LRRGNQLRILVVDQELIREAMRQMRKQLDANIEAVEAANWVDALTLV
jgi:hypothetical protein